MQCFHWAALVVLTVATSGCGDSGELGKPKAQTADAATGGLFDALASAEIDAAPLADGAATIDSEDSAVRWQEAFDGGSGEVTAVADTASAEVAPTLDADAPAGCGGCQWHQQPAPPHPGAKGSYALAPEDTFEYGAGGLGPSYKQVYVVRPDATGIFPVVFFVHGKQLHEGGGFPAKLAHPYKAFLHHIAAHGYVVAFVRVEQGLLDADHLRMADDLLTATQVVFDKVSLADPNKVAYVGHSMGAKVVLLATWKTLNTDSANKWVDPRAVLAFSVSNEPPPLGEFQNALDKAKVMYKDAPTWFTFATGDDDDIAPWQDPKKANAKALYDALQTERKQLLVVHGTGPGDPNPSTKPELVDDHAAPLSIEGKPGGLADLAMPASHLDALDWYGFWKWTVGALDFHFKQGDPKWAYGSERQMGGQLPDGTVLDHQVAAQGWQLLPAP